MVKIDSFAFEVPDPYRNDVVLSDLLPRNTGDLGSRSSEPANQGVTRRKILRPEFHDNPRDPNARVRITLMHQRRRSTSARNGDLWEDADSFNLTFLKAGEEIRFELRSTETKRLFFELFQLYERAGTLNELLAEIGLQLINDGSAIVVEGREKQILEAIFEREGDGTWELLDQLSPHLSVSVAARKQYELRSTALNKFEEMIINEHEENEWQEFFKKNDWIFGYGLSYQFLTNVDTQPTYRGPRVSGTGAQRGDFLMRTEAQVRFTVLVEIKKPSTSLLKNSPYRPNSGYFPISNDLAGGVAQVQANCESWSRSFNSATEDILDLINQHTFTHAPKGFLVLGHTRELESQDKRGSFERFRRSVANPEILTFDELLLRARYLVDSGFDSLDVSSSLSSEDPEFDDNPF